MQRPTMMTVLSEAGLASLEALFRAEHIDEDLFWTLADGDLRDLGLTLGQRKRLRAAIEAAGGTSSVAAALPEGLERRRLTVIFIDMAGSTRLAEELSPDDLHAVFQSFYLAAGGVARRFGGYLASLHGDGVIMLFGYPRTRLGDAERGLAAALALQEELSAREFALPSGRPVALGFRAGVATGEAVIGRPELHQGNERLHMVGQVMHRSARLQGVAPLGGVVADAETRAQAGGHFAFETLGEVALQGFGEAGALFRVTGPARDAGAAEGPLPPGMIGREEDCARLESLWAEACEGRTRMAVVTGEAGLGKTTLLRETIARIRRGEVALRRLSCSPLAQMSAFAPVIARLEDLVGGAAPGTAGARREALAHAMEGHPADQVALVADLIGLAPDLPAGDGAAPQPPGPKNRGQRAGLIAILAEWLVESRDGRPVLLVLEDAHWCDATTRDLLEAAAERAAGRPVMMLATSRNPAEPLWQEAEGARRMALAGLAEAPARRLFRRALAGNVLPEAVETRMLGLAEGNPLMLESAARAVAGDRVGSIAGDVAVPRTIYESVGERLDLLRAGRPVAAALAVFDMPAGREMLAAIAGVAAAELQAGIEELLASGLVAEQGAGGSYRFYHQLYRDVVYERIVAPQRRGLHGAALALLRGQPAGGAAQR
ncbi:AAA family ATPase, partial [Mangrovicoccus algicola]